MEVNLTGKRVAATPPQGSESDSHQAVEDAPSMRVAQSGSIEVT